MEEFPSFAASNELLSLFADNPNDKTTIHRKHLDTREDHVGGAPSSEPLGSQVCDVCQGVCDMNHPRGVMFPVPDDSENMYCYTYIHHANLKALFASADAGCTICKVIGNSFGKFAREVARKGSEDIEHTVADDSAPADSGAHTVQSDEDVVAAIRLAELVKRGQLYGAGKFSIDDPGRIIVQWFGKNKSDLSCTALVELRAFVLDVATAASTAPEESTALTCPEQSDASTCSEDSDYTIWTDPWDEGFWCYLACLITPCMSDLGKDIINFQTSH